MNICIKRNYLNEEWDSDDNLVLVNRTCIEYLDDATIGEIKIFRGKSDEHEIKSLRLGELDVSMQLAYRLYRLRDDRDPIYEIGKDGYEPMTEEEFASLFPEGENSDTSVDICIWNNVTKKTYQNATQANLREIDNFLRGIVYESKMDCLV